MEETKREGKRVIAYHPIHEEMKVAGVNALQIRQRDAVFSSILTESRDAVMTHFGVHIKVHDAIDLGRQGGGHAIKAN